jgi:hypothetical protein
MAHGKRFGSVLLALLLSSGAARAWNGLGHMAIAKLAFDQFDDGQKARAGKLLRQHPHYDEFLVKNRPEGVAEAEWAFLKAATWPDWVRPRRRDDRGERVLKYHRGSDHYIDFPLIRIGGKILVAGPALGPAPDTPDILSALKERIGDLTEKSAAPADRAVALCWLEHLIGDLHQPLHSVALFSDLFPDGDRGGNLFGVRVNGRKVNLHAYWDGLLGADVNGGAESPEANAALYRRVSEAAEGLRDPRFARDRLPELLKNVTFPSWAQESVEAAREVAYGKIPVEPVLVTNGSVPDAAREAGADYERAALEVARRRAALAGHRLADRLKTLPLEP